MRPKMFFWLVALIAPCITLSGSLHALTADQKSAETKLRESIENDVRISWYTRDYAKLDELFNRFRSTGELSPNGRWKLEYAHGAFDEIFSTINGAEFPSGELWTSSNEWRQASPQSVQAAIAQAKVLGQIALVGTNAASFDPKAQRASSPILNFAKEAEKVLRARPEVS